LPVLRLQQRVFHADQGLRTGGINWRIFPGGQILIEQHIAIVRPERPIVDRHDLANVATHRRFPFAIELIVIDDQPLRSQAHGAKHGRHRGRAHVGDRKLLESASGNVIAKVAVFRTADEHALSAPLAELVRQRQTSHYPAVPDRRRGIRAEHDRHAPTPKALTLCCQSRWVNAYRRIAAESMCCAVSANASNAAITSRVSSLEPTTKRKGSAAEKSGS
jgi:hypothetical protein